MLLDEDIYNSNTLRQGFQMYLIITLNERGEKKSG